MCLLNMVIAGYNAGRGEVDAGHATGELVLSLLNASKAGDSISTAVSANDLDAGEWFLADDLSLSGLRAPGTLAR